MPASQKHHSWRCVCAVPFIKAMCSTTYTCTQVCDKESEGTHRQFSVYSILILNTRHNY